MDPILHQFQTQATEHPLQACTDLRELTRTDPHESAAADPDQLQSHFFSKLPNEIRTLIYRDVVNDFGKTIHVIDLFAAEKDVQRQLAYKPCTAEPEGHPLGAGDCYIYGRPTVPDPNAAAVPKKTFASLLLICKRMYVHQHPLPFLCIAFLTHAHKH
jgi:hypothetical protein